MAEFEVGRGGQSALKESCRVTDAIWLTTTKKQILFFLLKNNPTLSFFFFWNLFFILIFFLPPFLFWGNGLFLKQRKQSATDSKTHQCSEGRSHLQHHRRAGGDVPVPCVFFVFKLGTNRLVWVERIWILILDSVVFFLVYLPGKWWKIYSKTLSRKKAGWNRWHQRKKHDSPNDLWLRMLLSGAPTGVRGWMMPTCIRCQVQLTTYPLDPSISKPPWDSWVFYANIKRKGKEAPNWEHFFVDRVVLFFFSPFCFF